MRSGRPLMPQRGAALLLAMVIVALVAAVTAGMVWQQTRAVQVEAAERARAQAGWILSGALDWARLILREDLRNNRSNAQPHDSLDEPWATPLAEARLSTFLAADKDNNVDAGPEAFISGSISDVQARFNLRGLLASDGKALPPQQAALDRLCGQAGAPTDTAQRIVQGLQAALFPEAEATASTAAGPPLRPGRLADLAWLGIDAATLARLEPFVDMLPVATPVNLNTAPREVIVAAIDGIDPGSAERLVQARQRKPFRTLDEALEQLPQGTKLDANRVSVTSSYFEVAGRLRLEDRVLEERSLLVRRENQVDVLRRERQSFTTAGR
ncbi:MAG: type II secretion system minor pseudopilin GspK [Rubrivivax sp.]|nr:type II secretion system minor pseudopilin GspK [Rubrivivax sp.]